MLTPPDYFKQIDGVPLGSSVGPVLAIIFVSKKTLNWCCSENSASGKWMMFLKSRVTVVIRTHWVL